MTDTDKQWERHKNTISRLYLAEGLTRHQVVAEMAEKHGFHADAGQYERQFKKWKLRKGLKPDEWKKVARRVQKRKLDGKESDLWVDGILIPKAKVYKAISRYQPSTLERFQPGKAF
ncbi:uncharacterized protein K452DRAFT_45005 [Aplosporella prunicola CBS 121167]|uniref:Clr5 domain-containing protein n=1 Tax=Aplosporella prunicola CBS 121167 TaxID=1176127 RepID=A0A6A6BCJ5_9PEZI|nr:uncharacterized protein K452DRAFT_45005 [Aplosporella prunicola CBS 121167]KAF2141083.1 hypothetical protein K452DRAFT_45005 [Aplosporella prunicola CBS 121167]